MVTSALTKISTRHARNWDVHSRLIALEVGIPMSLAFMTIKIIRISDAKDTRSPQQRITTVMVVLTQICMSHALPTAVRSQ